MEQFHLIKHDDISEDMWGAISKLHAGQSRYANPFFTPSFAKLVGAVRHDLNVLIGEDDNGLTHFWPLHISFLRRARGIGGPFSDRNAPILRDGYYLDIPTLFAKHNIESMTTSGLCHSEIAESESFAYVPTNGTDLSGGYESFLETQKALHGSHYKRLRRLKRKLERDHTEIEFRFDDQSEDSYQQLIAMKRDQFKATGKHDVLSPEWVATMFEALRAQDNPECRTRMATLYVDGHFVAGELNLQSHYVLHGWIVAYDRAFSKYSPGNLLTHFILENMTAHSMTYYDSGTGGDHYKKYITNHHEMLGTGVVYSDVMIPMTRQVLSKVWNKAENIAPEQLSYLLARTRRRSEQILATEIKLGSLLRGYSNALKTKKTNAPE